MTSKEDIFQLRTDFNETIQSICAINTFATGGCDKTLALSSLHLNHVGDVQLPLTHSLRPLTLQPPVSNLSSDINSDANTSNSFSFSAAQVTLPLEFHVSVQTIARAHSAKLGVRSATNPITVSLSRLVVHEGSESDINLTTLSDTDCIYGMKFAKLILQLPASRQGGVLQVKHNGRQENFPFLKENQTQFFATTFFNACHSVKFTRVSSGLLCFFEYDVKATDLNTTFIPFPDGPKRAVKNLSTLAKKWEQLIDERSDETIPKFFVLPLCHFYETKEKTLNQLKGKDASRVSVINSCQELKCFHSIVEKWETGTAKKVVSFHDHAQTQRGSKRRKKNNDCDDDDEEPNETSSDAAGWEIDKVSESELQFDSFTQDGKAVELFLLVDDKDDYGSNILGNGEVFKQMPHSKTLNFDSREAELQIRNGFTPVFLELIMECVYRRSVLFVFPAPCFADVFLSIGTDYILENMNGGLLTFEDVFPRIRHTHKFCREGSFLVSLLDIAVQRKLKSEALEILRVFVKWWPRPQYEDNCSEKNIPGSKPGLENTERVRSVTSLIKTFGWDMDVRSTVMELVEQTTDKDLGMLWKLTSALYEASDLPPPPPIPHMQDENGGSSGAETSPGIGHEVVRSRLNNDIEAKSISRASANDDGQDQGRNKAAEDIGRLALDRLSASKYLTLESVKDITELIFSDKWAAAVIHDLPQRRGQVLQNICNHPDCIKLMASVLETVINVGNIKDIHQVYDAMISSQSWRPDTVPKCEEEVLSALATALLNTIQIFTWTKIKGHLLVLASQCKLAAASCLLLAMDFVENSFGSGREIAVEIATHVMQNLPLDSLIVHTDLLNAGLLANFVFSCMSEDNKSQIEDEENLVKAFLKWLVQSVRMNGGYSILYNLLQELVELEDRQSTISILRILAGDDDPTKTTNSRMNLDLNGGHAVQFGGGIQCLKQAKILVSIILTFGWKSVGPYILHLVETTPPQMSLIEHARFVKFLEAEVKSTPGAFLSILGTLSEVNVNINDEWSIAANQVGAIVVNLYSKSSTRIKEETIDVARIAFRLIETRPDDFSGTFHEFIHHLSAHALRSEHGAVIFCHLLSQAVIVTSKEAAKAILRVLTMESGIVIQPKNAAINGGNKTIDIERVHGVWDDMSSNAVKDAILTFGSDYEFISIVMNLVRRTPPKYIKFTAKMVESIRNGMCVSGTWQYIVVRDILAITVDVFVHDQGMNLDAFDMARSVFQFFECGHNTRSKFMSMCSQFSLETVKEVVSLSLSELQTMKVRLCSGSTAATTLVAYQQQVVNSVLRYLALKIGQYESLPTADNIHSKRPQNGSTNTNFTASDITELVDIFTRILDLCPEPLLREKFVNAIIQSKSVALHRAVLFDETSKICDRLASHLIRALEQGLASLSD